MTRMASRWCAYALLALMTLSGAAGAQISLSLVNSYAKNAPFGLAFDGTDLWWSSTPGVAYQMNLSGVETGNSVVMPNGWSALAYDASRANLVSKGYGGGSLNWFRTTDGVVTLSIAAPEDQFGLIDGLDVENGELWYSPDVSEVFRYAINYGTSSLTDIGGQPVIGGLNSGVEHIAAGGTEYIITVDDGSSPRKLCVYRMDYTQVGCSTFQNDRYEDIAFDGRYLWAADYYGNKIDQYDILGEGGGSIISATPEPATIVLTASGLLFVAGIGHRRRTREA